MQKLQIKVSGDRRTATLPFSDEAGPVTLDADEMTRLIHTLAVVRARMLPSFPKDDGRPSGAVVHDVCERWYVAQDHVVETAIRLSLLHPGVGWVSIALSRAQAGELTGAVENVLPQLPKVQ